MTGCSVIGCKNRSERGFLMKKFPSDPKRRAEWIAIVKGNRANWEPKPFSCVCEVHFEPCMWEKQREDGKRALKWNAMPTLVNNGDLRRMTKQVRKQKLLQLQPQKQQLQSQQLQPLILKNRLILPKPGLIIQINRTNPKDKDPTPAGEIKAAGSEESRPYIDPLHNYCRKAVDDQNSTPSQLKLKQNMTATITNPTDKFHNYFSKVGNVKNQIQVQVPKSYQPVQPKNLNFAQKDTSPFHLSPITLDNEDGNFNLPVECIMIDNDLSEDFEDENVENKAKTKLQNLPSKLNQIKEKYIFSRLSHVKCNDAACDRLHLQKERTINLLKSKIVALRRENSKLLKKLSEPNEMVAKVFNPDQVHAAGHKKSTKWSSETIIKALELVIACGLKGYREILRQNLPYPSIRTLQRKLDCDIS